MIFLKPTIRLNIFQHLNGIEERVLESLAWTTVSEMYDVRRSCFFFSFFTKNVSVSEGSDKVSYITTLECQCQ